MRIALWLLFVLAASGCSTTHVPPAAQSKLSSEKVTFYDRNRDGLIDIEDHDFGCCDRNWALVDTDFDSRFDVKFVWGYAFERESVDIAVPKGSPISEKTAPNWSPLIR